QLLYLHGLKRVGFEVNDVNATWRIAQHLFRGNVDAQIGLTRGDQDRIVIRKAIDCTSAQSRHHTNESIATVNPGRPAKLVIAEGNSRARREEVLPYLLPNNFLYEDAHLLVHVQQAALSAIFGGVWAKDRGIDLGNRVHQRGKPLFFRTAVSEEQ